MSRSVRNLISLILLIGIALGAWFLQTQFLINGDISWDLLVTKRLLKGGSYTKDFFDLNPPLIFFEYIPSVFLEKFFLMTEATAFVLYVILLSFASLGFCAFFINAIFPKKDKILAYAFFMALACIFLILPMYELGQREHFMLIFTMPFFLATVYRLQGDKLPLLLAVMVGIFAALGFGIKPYFILPLILTEIYYMFLTRNIFSWLRAEMLAIIFLLMTYVLSVFIFYPDYIFTVVPMAHQFYYKSFSEPWYDVLLSWEAIFCYLVVFVYFLQIKNKDYRFLKSILFIAMLGFLFVYFFQKINWYYHIIPAYSIAILLSILLMSIFIIDKKNIILVSICGGSLFALAFINVQRFYVAGIAQVENTRTLIAFMKKHAEHQPVYMISSSVAVNYSALTYANTIFISRFLHLFWMPTIIKHSIQTPTQNVENSFVDMIAEDISAKKPKLIFVDVADFKPYCSFIHFDYLPYLLKNAHFNAAWEPYHYFTTLEKYEPPKNQSDWNLYFFRNKKSANLASIEDHSIVLTGEGNAKTMNIVKDKKWLSANNKMVYRVVTFTPDELNVLNTQSGLIKRNIQNEHLLDAILTKAIYLPIYKLQVYQRDETYDGVA